MAAEFDRALYQQLGELTAEVRALRTSIDRAQEANGERFDKLEKRVDVIERKVDAIESIADKVRGATALAKALYLTGGLASGGVIATVLTQVLGT